MVSTGKETLTISRENYDEMHSAFLDAANDIDFLSKDNQVLLDFIHYAFCGPERPLVRWPTAARRW